MEEKAVELLSQLAKTLGVSSDFILQTLYKQIPVKIFGEIIFILIMLSIVVASIVWAKRFWVMHGENKNAERSYYEGGYGIAAFACWLSVTLFSVMGLVGVISLVTFVVNPDMYIFEQIQRMILRGGA